MSILHSRFDQRLYFNICSKKNLRNAIRHNRKKGQRTPGVDNVTMKDWINSGIRSKTKELYLAMDGLDAYEVGEVRETFITKDNGKKRRIAVLNLVDNVVSRACYQVLSEVFDSRFNHSNFGYRPRRNRGQAAVHCQQLINSGATYWVKADIKDCFGNIKRKRLKGLLSVLFKDKHQKLLEMLKQFVDMEKRPLGIVQGGCLSPFFSNVYLDEVDTKLAQEGFLFAHYGDDYVIGCRSEEDAWRALETLDKHLKEVDLSINDDKSNIVEIENDKLNFCGFSITKDNIEVSEQSAKRMLRKSKRLIDDFCQSDAIKLDEIEYFEPNYEQDSKNPDYRKRERKRRAIHRNFDSVIAEHGGILPRWLSYVQNWAMQHEIANPKQVNGLVDLVFKYRAA